MHETATDAYAISGREVMKIDCNASLTDWKRKVCHMQYKDEKAKIAMRFMEDEEPKGRHSTVVFSPYSYTFDGDNVNEKS